ncbi:uncharacterized protein J8A68_001496 [[Candida] subhashii]|uniref:Coatomer subunit epsilon n=1 Tax=[Candida] subhashii TaxID=561895 RepID=A0A8J5UJZ9_9ASCO|nr:uncharacterized protein J8A68_001496 [[Candida] subhashii]KAG7664968.1 hypothetical protein J8A68_001496 [[Candida] subhashii]
MDTFTDSGELYNIKNQFYTNQFQKVISYTLDQFSPESQLKVLEFQIRSTIALEQDASELIEYGKVQFSDEDQLFELLTVWNDLMTFGMDDSTYFQDIQQAEFELQAVLTAIYLVQFEKDIDQAIDFLNSYVNESKNVYEIEPFLILMQLYLIRGNYTLSDKLFNNLKRFPDIKDNIIYQIIESWMLSIKGESDNINNSFYFYDELLSTGLDDDESCKFKILSILFVLTIQLKHYPEAQELLKQIDSLKVKPNGDFIANKITFEYLTQGNQESINLLLQELEKVDPEHQYLVDLQERNSIFNEIVTKYHV